MLSFRFVAHSGVLGSICFRLKNALCFFSRLKVKRGLQKTYFLPLISIFTLVNSELRNFSSDKMTPKLLIINNSRYHLSLVTFAFTLSFMYYISFLCRKNLVDMKISCKFTVHIFTLITFSSLVCEDRRRFSFPLSARFRFLSWRIL